MTISTVIKTETYYIGQGYNTDVVEGPADYEAWLYHNNIGIKELMFGVPKKENTKKEFLEMVERNVSDYIISYEEEYR